MVKIAYIQSMKIEMYYNDHNPPHFHIITSDNREGVFWIDGTYDKGNLRNKEIKAISSWVAQNEQALLLAWREYVERGNATILEQLF